MAKQIPKTCRWCKEKQLFDEKTMTFRISTSANGRDTKVYYHIECLNKYNEKQDKELSDKEFRVVEQVLLDKLVEVAGAIHEAPKPVDLAYQMPRIWYHMIQDFRNGTQRYTSNFKKRYKKGVPYEIITEAYKLSKDGIKWARMDKQFKDSASECRYALAIVSNKIPDAIKKLERDKAMDKVNKAREQKELEDMKHEREAVYKPKKASYDISELFD